MQAQFHLVRWRKFYCGMREKEIVFLNGKFLGVDEAKLPVSIPGFLYGWGLFETMRFYNYKIVYLDEHLKRIKNSCKLIEMGFPYSIDKLKVIIKKTIKINSFSDAYVRLTLWKSKKSTDVCVITRKYQPPSFRKYRNGFRACVSTFKQNENYFFSRLKTTNYLLYQLSYLQAKSRNFDEAIILNNRGYIAEASRSNIFFIKNNEILTPSLGCGCLDGITRKVIFDFAKKYGMPLREGNLTLSNLYEADEAFLTNSLIGIMPLASIENYQIGQGANKYKLTKFFIERYKYLLRGENKK